MSKNTTKTNKKKNSSNAQPLNPQSVAIGQAVSDSEAYSKTVEIREKRIGIVFKVLYVLAIFFAAIFIDMGTSFGKGLTPVYLIEVCAAAFLLMLLVYMVIYIINEMKCLKLTATDVPQRQINATEKSYTNIFNYLYVVGAAVVLGISLGANLMRYITAEFLTVAFLVSAIIWVVMLALQTFLKRDVFGVLCCFSATVMLMFLFLLPALNMVTENVPT